MGNIEKLLRTAQQYKASDLFITTGAKPTLRINGDLVVIKEHAELTAKDAEAYISEIISEKQKAELQKGKDLDFSVNFPEISNFRVNVFRQRKGLGAALRLISSDIPTLEELQFPKHIEELVDLPHGLVLVTGPTGCGKSTTLAALIGKINQEQPKHIITIENPIEYIHENGKSIIDQREVGTHTEGFESALKSSLRESPDVILVGEMRDLETIRLAITAAETGHLVFATLHTSGAANTVNRIIDVFPSEQQDQIRTQLSESVQAVIWQKLIKTSDGKSRIPAIEVLRGNHAVANLIRKGSTHQLDSVLETHRKEGMQTMKRHLLELAAEGKVDKDEALRHLPPEFEE